MLYLRLLSECGCLLFESINHYPSINVHFNIQRGRDSRVTTLLEAGGPRFLFFTTSSFTSYSWPGPRPDCSKVVSGWPRAFRISPFSSFCQTERCPHTLTMWSQTTRPSTVITETRKPGPGTGERVRGSASTHTAPSASIQAPWVAFGCRLNSPSLPPPLLTPKHSFSLTE